MKTKTIFRKFKDNGDIIALFPEYPTDINGRYCDSYMHIGQHGAADYAYLLRWTVPATPEEYAELKRELETHYDYEIEVYQRRTPQMRNAYRQQMRDWYKEIKTS